MCEFERKWTFYSATAKTYDITDFDVCGFIINAFISASMVQFSLVDLTLKILRKVGKTLSLRVQIR